MNDFYGQRTSDLRLRLKVLSELIEEHQKLHHARFLTITSQDEWVKHEKWLNSEKETIDHYAGKRDAIENELAARRRIRLDNTAVWAAGGVIALTVYIVVLTIVVING